MGLSEESGSEVDPVGGLKVSDLQATQGLGNRAALMQQFAEWLLLTPEGRNEAGLPATQKGMAELLGKSEATLSVWKKSDKFQRMVGRHVRSNFGADRLGRVIDALFDTATSSQSAAQVSAAKTLLGWYEHDNTGVEATDLEQLSDEELRLLAQRVLTAVDDNA